eukprot:Sspe_Gene.52501::Locus_29084_Transcript_1_1_Confidence_1.000_Length_1878::g.52501::m.52501/K05657/ABCB10; ATP-binding cassette, subfamily B (MDR/TAP), member 10
MPSTAVDLDAEDMKEAEVKEEKKKKKSRTRIIRRMLSLAQPELRSILGSVLFLGVYSSVTLTIPRQLGTLIDLASKGSRETLRQQSIKLAGLFCIGGAANFLRLYLEGKAADRIVNRLRVDLFQKLLNQPMSFFDNKANRTGELVQRLSGDSEKVGQSLTASLTHGAKSLTQSVGALSVMFRLSPRLATLLLAMLPPVALTAACYGRAVRGLERKAGDEVAAKMVTAEEQLSSIRVVVAFGQQHTALQRYLASVRRVEAANHLSTMAHASFSAFLQTSGYFVVLALLWYGGTQVASGKLSVGALTSMLLYNIYGGLGIMGIGNFYADMIKGTGTAERVFELLDQPDAATPSRGLCESHMLPEDAVGGELAVRGVTFCYPSRATTVWRDVSFTIPGGRCCAIVGHSGAGKTTLVNLLLKLYPPTSGSIRLDGVDLKDIPDAYVRKLVAYVPQDPLLFADTIAQNILYGLDPKPAMDSEHARQLMIEAAKRANAHEFISQLEAGYDTFVGERGTQLSGGQRQRIAIARALIKERDGHARILVFDEATSGLDVSNRRILQETIKGILRDAQQARGGETRRTVVVITHDEELMKCCDRIVVLRDGEVAAQGTYTE